VNQGCPVQKLIIATGSLAVADELLVAGHVECVL
jgi:hypothetical protein